MPTTQPQSSKVSCAAGPARPDGELKRLYRIGQSWTVIEMTAVLLYKVAISGLMRIGYRSPLPLLGAIV
jgi:hypothetical protein